MSRTNKPDTLVFKALADEKRRKILDLLKEKPLTTGDICARFRGVDRCTVMLHLQKLERAGLIIVRREGRERWNHLDAMPIKRIYDRWISQYAAGAVDFLSDLKLEMEK